MKWILFVASVVLTSLSPALADMPAVDFVVGMSDVGYSSAMVVWVPLSPDQAISGLVWYNNDCTVVFPVIALAAGTGEQPCLLEDMTDAVQCVQGGSSQWSEEVFPASMASTVEGLYLALRFPVGSVQIEAGTGGGAGVGCSEEAGGLSAWTTLDGETWLPVHGSLNLAMIPQVVPANEYTIWLEAPGNKSQSGESEEAQVPLVTKLAEPQPNPFNPQTKLTFTLEKKGPITLEIYDVRGRVVKTLAKGRYSAGPHVMTWQGDDDRGHRVASGVYLTRLHTEHVDLVQQMLLLK